MAQPTNTFDSYDSVGIKEDLSDVIHDISPEDTPFYSRCSKGKATNTLTEWQTDALRASAANAHIEGDDTSAEARTPTTRLGNYTQIFKNAVIIPDTDEGLDKAGRAKEIGYQMMKVAKEQKLDIERALFLNNAREAGNSTTARELAGIGAWIKTNVSMGTGGSNPTGDGTDARTDGTQRALTQDYLVDVMQGIWNSGGKPDRVYLSAFQKRVTTGFTGFGNQRTTIDAKDTKVIDAVDVYVSDFGTVEFSMSREMRSREVFVCDDDMWEIKTLRGTKQTDLAKTGDNTKKQVVTELTLCAKNEASSGLVADLTTS